MPKFFKSIWFWLTLFFASLICLGIVLVFITETQASYMAIIGSIIVGLFSFGGAILNFISNSKKAAIENFEKINKIINDFRQETMDKQNKAVEQLNDKYAKFEGTATELYIDTVNKLEKNILQEVRTFSSEITRKMDKLEDSVKVVSDNMNKIETGLKKIEESKDRKEQWAKEFERDWEGCRSRIRMINDKDLYNGSLFIKESFKEYAMEILSWNLYTSTESDKDNLIERIIEKFDITMEDVYQHNLCLNKEHNVVFKEINKANEIAFKMKITKSFKENIVNNISKNFFNYSSQYLNDVLNTYAQAFLKVHGVNHKED